MSKNGQAARCRTPSNYRNAAKYLRLAVEEKQNIKRQLTDDNHFRTGRTILYRLLVNLPQINAVIDNIKLLEKEPKLSVWMARALIGELLFGCGNILGNSPPVLCVRGYETEIRAAFTNTKANNPPIKVFKEPRFVRINTSTLNLEGAKRIMQEEGWVLVDEEFTNYQSFLDRMRALTDSEYLLDFHFNDILVFPNSAKGYWARAEHLRPKFYLQNKACLVPTYLLNPVKKSVVLDMCAAPGLKTTHLASLMKNKGRIYAVERNAERYGTLCQYAAELGVIKTIHADCLTIDDEQAPGVQYILIDPSCSGSGMLSRMTAPEPVDETRLFKLAGLQYKLLSHAMNAFPNANRIVYSTCSIHTEENEKVVQGVLRHNGHFKLLDARQELGKEWLNVGSPEFPGIGERCLYARPEIDLTIGMFVAIFERCDTDEVNEHFAGHGKQRGSYDRLSTSGKIFGGNPTKDTSLAGSIEYDKRDLKQGDDRVKVKKSKIKYEKNDDAELGQKDYEEVNVENMNEHEIKVEDTNTVEDAEYAETIVKDEDTAEVKKSKKRKMKKENTEKQDEKMLEDGSSNEGQVKVKKSKKKKHEKIELS